ncbi:hypothetical protein QJQ45_021996, partial [Haematococcus lacustris]
SARYNKMWTVPALLLVALGGAFGAGVRQAADCVSADALGVPAFPSQFRLISASGLESTVTPSYALNFNVNYFDTYKIVVNRRQSANETYVLYQCGTQPPPPSAVPAGAKFFSVPLSSVSVDDTTVVAFMKLLGVSNRITFTSRFAVDACQQSIGFYGCQQLAPGNPAPSASNVNATLAVRAIANKVDAFFTYGNTANNMTISVTASADPGVLNRAEWIKYVATFFNVEDKANNIFTQVAQSYASTKAAVANVVASLPPTQQPIVAWLYYQPANPAWGPVFGREVVQVQLSKYRYQLTQDAGGVMISPAAFAPFVDGTNVVDTTVAGLGNINLYNFTTMGQVLRSALANVTWVIDETRYPDVRNQDLTLNNFVSTFGFSAADLASLPFLRDGKIVRVDKESNPDGYTSWYEMAVARPDQVLMDLANLFHPTALASNAAPTFLRSLTAGQVTLASAAQCPLVNCQAPVTPICPLVFRACNGSVVIASAAQRCAPSCNTTSTPTASPTTSSATLQSPASHPWLAGVGVVLSLAAALLVV